MRKIYEPQAVADCIERSPHRSILKTLPPELFLLQYEKGELVTAPFVKEQWFQTVISGSLNIYFIRDDGGLYSLSDGKAGYILGDMELFNPNISSVYTEAAEPLLCLALSIDKNRVALLDNNEFLRLMCQSLTAKMEAITALEAAPCSLHDRVLYYMRYKCEGGELKGLERGAFRLHCSARQLQRILNQFEQEGKVVKVGKGAYRLINDKSEPHN